MLIIDDDESLAAALPSEYGVDDIPLIIQDRDFSDAGQFRYISFMPEQMIGKHGKTLLVNGGIAPRFEARKSLLRLRLLNASNARFYRLGFSDERPFQVIASDGGLLQQAVTLTQLELAPAERYEILLDLSDRKPVMLQSRENVGNSQHGPMHMLGMNIPFDILLIDPTRAKRSVHPGFSHLTSIDEISNAAEARYRELELQMGMQGGVSGGMMGQFIVSA